MQATTPTNNVAASVERGAASQRLPVSTLRYFWRALVLAAGRKGRPAASRLPSQRTSGCAASQSHQACGCSLIDQGADDHADPAELIHRRRSCGLSCPSGAGLQKTCTGTTNNPVNVPSSEQHGQAAGEAEPLCRSATRGRCASCHRNQCGSIAASWYAISARHINIPMLPTRTKRKSTWPPETSPPMAQHAMPIPIDAGH